MKKLAILAILALELAVGGCGRSTPINSVTTTTSGSWEAQLFGGSIPSGQLNFVTAFNVTTFSGQANQSLDITGIGFYNANSCFPPSLGNTATNESGNATLNTNSAGQVSGSLNYSVNSTNNGNALVLTTSAVSPLPAGGLYGTSNGTTTTTGTLSNGVIWGNWTLTSNDSSCVPNGGSVSGTFIMCQGTSTCTIP